MSRCTDLFAEVTNITKGNGIWTHFVSTRYFLSQIQLSRPIQKDDVQIELSVVYSNELELIGEYKCNRNIWNDDSYA